MENNNDTSAPATTPYPDPVFQAFVVKTTGGRPRQEADNAVTNVLGAGWAVENYGGNSRNFEIYKEEGVLTPSRLRFFPQRH